MAHVYAEIDMTDIDTDDLVEEICRRLRRHNSRGSFTAEQKDRIKREYGHLRDALQLSPEIGISIKTLEDKMKFEHLANVFNKYSSSEIEKLLP